jgi:hypothetical protein
MTALSRGNLTVAAAAMTVGAITALVIVGSPVVDLAVAGSGVATTIVAGRKLARLRHESESESSSTPDEN